MENIFALAKDTIQNTTYDLGEKLNELTAILIVGQITTEEYQVLVHLAYEHADPESTETNVLLALQTINSELVKINARLDALEAEGGDEPEEEEYPEWKRWDGTPDSGYQFGDKVTHLGVKYISNYVGLNVWEPGVQGTELLWGVIE